MDYLLRRRSAVYGLPPSPAIGGVWPTSVASNPFFGCCGKVREYSEEVRWSTPSGLTDHSCTPPSQLAVHSPLSVPPLSQVVSGVATFAPTC